LAGNAEHRDDEQPYVAVSEISVPEAGEAALEQAFRRRLHAVDGWPGFRGLELLRDRKTPGRYIMICRWDTREQFLAYMRSADHRRSHDRIPRGPLGPAPAGFTEYDRVAE
jgi:heme-degrading monooxygenase HmoA